MSNGGKEMSFKGISCALLVTASLAPSPVFVSAVPKTESLSAALGAQEHVNLERSEISLSELEHELQRRWMEAQLLSRSA